jgi:hypothetical protein
LGFINVPFIEEPTFLLTHAYVATCTPSAVLAQYLEDCVGWSTVSPASCPAADLPFDDMLIHNAAVCRIQIGIQLQFLCFMNFNLLV